MVRQVIGAIPQLRLAKSVNITKSANAYSTPIVLVGDQCLSFAISPWLFAARPSDMTEALLEYGLTSLTC